MVREAQQPAWLVRENERARVRQKARVREVWVYRQVTRLQPAVGVVEAASIPGAPAKAPAGHHNGGHKMWTDRSPLSQATEHGDGANTLSRLDTSTQALSLVYSRYASHHATSLVYTRVYTHTGALACLITLGAVCIRVYTRTEALSLVSSR